MARKGADKVDGWLILDKPAGISSTAALGRARRALNAGQGGPCRHARSAGDRRAGARLRRGDQAAQHGDRDRQDLPLHRALGRARDTDDAEGQVTATSQIRSGAAEIEAGLAAFRGAIVQVPPDYSAVKLQGKPAYARRRAGEEVEIAPPRASGSTASSWSRRRTRTTPYLWCSAAKAPISGVWPATWPPRSAAAGMSRSSRRLAVGRFAEADAIALEKLEASGIVPPLWRICERSRPRWTTSRRWP